MSFLPPLPCLMSTPQTSGFYTSCSLKSLVSIEATLSVWHLSVLCPILWNSFVFGLVIFQFSFLCLCVSLVLSDICELEFIILYPFNSNSLSFHFVWLSFRLPVPGRISSSLLHVAVLFYLSLSPRALKAWQYIGLIWESFRNPRPESYPSDSGIFGLGRSWTWGVLKLLGECADHRAENLSRTGVSLYWGGVPSVCISLWGPDP